MSNVVILCHSKDCNREVTNEFMEGAIAHLPLDKYRLVVTNEHVPHDYKDCVLTGDGLWSTRLRNALNQIECEHVVFFLEDMIVKSCDKEIFEEVIKFHIANESDLTKFGVHPFFKVIDTGTRIGPHKVVQQLEMPYILSHQPASIWKKDFLLRVIQDDVSPWDHECVTGQELRNGRFGKYKVYCVGSYPQLNPPVGYDYGEIIKYHHLLTRGQRIPYIGTYP